MKPNRIHRTKIIISILRTMKIYPYKLLRSIFLPHKKSLEQCFDTVAKLQIVFCGLVGPYVIWPAYDMICLYVCWKIWENENENESVRFGSIQFSLVGWNECWLFDCSGQTSFFAVVVVFVSFVSKSHRHEITLTRTFNEQCGHYSISPIILIILSKLSEDVTTMYV